jgi:hypothetical protein
VLFGKLRLVRGDGSEGFRPLTALQRHAAYFDPEATGFVTVPNTVRGIRALGVGAALTWLLTFLIHAALVPRVGFNRRMWIDIRRLDHGVHDGDTGIFDGAGEVRPDVFEQLFLHAVGPERASDEEAAVTRDDLVRFMLRDEPFSAGAAFSWAEATLLLGIARTGHVDVRGRRVPAITKRRLRQFYDGRLFAAIARWRAVRELEALKYK